jgi:hypothetical protein
MLKFEVASFDIGYNYILGRPFLLGFMAVYCLRNNQDAWPQGVITLKSDQHDALACENATLTHAGRFGEKEAQNLATKVAKTHGEGTSARTVTPRPLAGDTPKMPVAKKGTMVSPTSTQRATDQSMAGERKGVTDKDPSDDDKKLRISTELDAK